MKRFTQPLALAAVTIGMAATAHAATMITPPASAGFAGAVLYCNLLNVGPAPLTATIEARDYNGNVLDTYTNLSINPGADLQLYSPTGVYCKFTFKGSKKRVRAAAQ